MNNIKTIFKNYSNRYLLVILILVVLCPIIILSYSAETNEYINSNLDEFIQKIKETGIEKTNISACIQSNIKENMWKEKQKQTEAETKNLYKIAKLFIEQIVQKRGQI